MTDDEKVAQRYRELGAEEPLHALDEAILAAARREVAARPAALGTLSARSSRQRWYAPLATAAVLVLAVAVTLNVQHERPGIESPAPQAASPVPAKEVASEAAKEAVITSRKRDQPVPAAPAAAVVPAAAPAPAVSSAPEPKPFVAGEVATAAPKLGEVARSEAAGASGALARQADERGSRNDQAERAPQLRSSPAMAMAKREAPAEMQAVPQQVETPERELERIARLRGQGRHDEADKALAEFRKRYPEFRISEAMRERVERR